MRTAKALGRKAGFGLCSKFAIVLYVVIIVMFYGIATLTISNQAAKRRIDILEKEKIDLAAAHDQDHAAHNADHAALAVEQKKHAEDHVLAMTSETQSARADGLAAKAEQAMLKLAKAKEKLEQTKDELKAHIEHHHGGVDDDKPSSSSSSSSGSGEKRAAVDASASATAAAAGDAHAEKAEDAAAAAAPSSPSGAVKPGSLSGLKLVGAEIAGSADLVRQAAVKEAFMHSWNGYKKYAWGTDELMPRTKAGHNWLNQGGTIIDAMSTLAVMGEVEEFKKNAEWIKSSLHFEGKGAVSFFETTIRVLGGILSAYEFSCDLYECDKGLLDKAKDIGTRLAKAFNTPSGMPYSTINLASGQGSTPGWTGGSAILAEVATIQMEFSTLSRHTGDKSFEEKAMAVFKKIHAANVADGLLPLYVSVQTGGFASNHVSLGAMGDSAFEYLIKTWVLRGRKEEWLKEMYDKATDGIMKHMVKTSAGDHRMYVAEYKGGSPIHKMDHLACFVGGMFLLGAPYATDPEEHIKVAKGVGETCFQMYATQKSGLSPENVEFGGGNMHAGSVYNIQRPEAVEAWFYLWRATKDPIWREHGWTMLQNFNKCCKIESGGYVGVRDVRQASPPLDDTQQTFWLAETLKYLYLLFSDDETIPLDKYVFNTEAHPLKIWADDAKK